MRKDLKLIGAAAERKAILRKLREINGSVADGSLAGQVISDIIEWLLKRDDRYNARKGGLGRKRKGV